MIAPKSRPLDLIAHRGEGTLIGAFRCPASDPRFVDSGPIQHDIFVFPRSAVRIRHAGGPSFVADHTVATVYNQGQIYDRGLVSEEGDRSDWFAVPRRVAVEAVAASGLEPRGSGPFPFPWVRVKDATYAAQRRLFRAALRGETPSAIDEGVYALLDEIVSSAAVTRSWRSSHEDARAREIADAIRASICARFEEKWSLSRLSQQISVSPFALCRAFRRATGSTIHRYQTTLRLRASLDRLEQPRVDLAGLAFDLGFSSHSHFTLTFSKRFEQSPSATRRSLAAPQRPGAPAGF
ncbi:MAG: AraC family transcriptional regulator [Vicinamibacteria bacterium]